MAAYAWIFYAILASIMWGLGYVLSEKIVKDMLPISFFAFINAILAAILYGSFAYFMDTHKQGFETLAQSPKVWLWVIAVTLVFFIGFLSILQAFTLKNAAIVNLIEISYPAFTLLFAWLLFKDVEMNLVQALGGLLIFCGAGLILWKS